MTHTVNHQCLWGHSAHALSLPFLKGSHLYRGGPLCWTTVQWSSREAMVGPTSPRETKHCDWPSSKHSPSIAETPVGQSVILFRNQSPAELVHGHRGHAASASALSCVWAWLERSMARPTGGPGESISLLRPVGRNQISPVRCETFGSCATSRIENLIRLVI